MRLVASDKCLALCCASSKDLRYHMSMPRNYGPYTLLFGGRMTGNGLVPHNPFGCYNRDTIVESV